MENKNYKITPILWILSLSIGAFSVFVMFILFTDSRFIAVMNFIIKLFGCLLFLGGVLSLGVHLLGYQKISKKTIGSFIIRVIVFFAISTFIIMVGYYTIFEPSPYD